MSQRAATRPTSAQRVPRPAKFEPVHTSDDDRRLRIRLRTSTPANAASSPACWRNRPVEHVARKNRGFVLRAIKGKGFGICATRDFVKGKLVPMGKDVLACRGEGESSAAVWARTSYKDKLAFLALANQSDLSTSVRRTAIGAEEAEASVEEVDAIFDTNCYARDHGDVIYRMGSRFNHSCLPNCEIEDGSDVEETYLRIHRNIQEGEEMVVTYLSDELMAADLEERRNYLFDSWGFHCDCVKCAKQAAKAKCTCQVCSFSQAATSTPTPPSDAHENTEGSERHSPSRTASTPVARMAPCDRRPLKRKNSKPRVLPTGCEDKDSRPAARLPSAPPAASNNASDALRRQGDADRLVRAQEGLERLDLSAPDHPPSLNAPACCHGAPDAQEGRGGADRQPSGSSAQSGTFEGRRAFAALAVQAKVSTESQDGVPVSNCEELSERHAPAGAGATPLAPQPESAAVTGAGAALLRELAATKHAASAELAGQRTAWSKIGDVARSAKTQAAAHERASTAGSRFAHVRSRLFDMTAAGRAKIKSKEKEACQSSPGVLQPAAAEGERNEGGDKGGRREGAGLNHKMQRARQQLMLGQSSLGMEDGMLAGMVLSGSFPQPCFAGQQQQQQQRRPDRARTAPAAAPSWVFHQSDRQLMCGVSSVTSAAAWEPLSAQSLRTRANRGIFSASMTAQSDVLCTVRQDRLTPPHALHASNALEGLLAQRPACPMRFSALLHRPQAPHARVR